MWVSPTSEPHMPDLCSELPPCTSTFEHSNTALSFMQAPLPFLARAPCKQWSTVLMHRWFGKGSAVYESIPRAELPSPDLGVKQHLPTQSSSLVHSCWREPWSCEAHPRHPREPAGGSRIQEQTWAPRRCSDWLTVAGGSLGEPPVLVLGLLSLVQYLG